VAKFPDVEIVDYLLGNDIGNMNPGARFQDHLVARNLMHIHNSDTVIALAFERLLSRLARVADRIDVDFGRGQVATTWSLWVVSNTKYQELCGRHSVQVHIVAYPENKTAGQ